VLKLLTFILRDWFSIKLVFGCRKLGRKINMNPLKHEREREPELSAAYLQFSTTAMRHQYCVRYE
jgi:hypothetical protein